MKAAGRAFAALALLILAYLAAGMIGAALPGSANVAAPQAPGPEHRIGLLAGPIHYDFLLPLTPETRRDFGFAGLDPAASWLTVGWGAAGFYTTVAAVSDLTPSILWRAVFGDDAVLRLDQGYDIFDPSGIRFIALSDAQYRDLRAAILASFARDSEGAPMPLAQPGFTPTDRYYTAKGHFSAARTCNVWIGDMLRAAGLRFGLWTPFTQSIRLSLGLYAPEPPSGWNPGPERAKTIP